jgi:CXXX repeat peptide maturase
MLSSESVQVCGYKKNNSKTEMIDPNILKEYLKLSKEKNYFLNFIYPSFQLENEYLKLLSSVDSQLTIPYTDQKDKYNLEDGVVFVISLGQELDSNFSCVNVILLIKMTQVSDLSDYVERLFKHDITRVNLVFDLEEISIDFDFDEYKTQLNKIADILFEYIKSNRLRYFNVLTDIFLLDKMNNCNAGISNITLGPDGRFYICPAFYYSGMPIERNDFSVPAKLKELLDFKKALICEVCDAFHCRRCVFDNYNKTVEFNIPGEGQCIMSHVERAVSMNLQKRLRKDINYNYFKNILTEKDYIDPFTAAKIW